MHYYGGMDADPILGRSNICKWSIIEKRYDYKRHIELQAK